MENSKQLWAILLDTRSIQKYIFAGNELKSQVGASYLVEQALTEVLLGTLTEVSGDEQLNDTDWKRQPEVIKITTDANVKCEIAYIGGGNALILFKEQKLAAQVVRSWSKKLLTYAPGLKTGATIGELDLTDDKSYTESLQKLRNQLKSYQNSVFPNISLPNSGLTLECTITGDTGNIYDSKRYISAEASAKLNAFAAAEDKLKKDNELTAMLQNTYYFTTDIDQLGQAEGESYVAIVHIDGNNMGIKFAQEGSNIAKYRQLSNQVAKKTRESFKKLIASIIEEYPNYKRALSDSKANILPIRPIIIGGDDITFVCPGRLGLEYAQRFIDFMRTDTEENKEIECCAGIAILPEKYPFFMGYELAEQLCATAKKKSRKHNDSSWFDFAILHGEQAPTLELIRATEYSGELGNMHFGPYKVSAGLEQSNSGDVLLGGARALADKEIFPRNKLQELRLVLSKGQHEITRFMEQLQVVGTEIPAIKGIEEYQKNLWYQGKTPYLDMIEIIDFVLPRGEEK